MFPFIESLPSTRRQIVAVNYVAKTYATAGKMQESLIYLRKALEAGFKDRKQLMKVKEFAALRSTPEFHQLMLQQTGGNNRLCAHLHAPDTAVFRCVRCANMCAVSAVSQFLTPQKT